VSEYPFQRRLGAFPLRNGRTEFRVWAQKPDTVALRVDGQEHPLEPQGFDIYETTVDADPGADYEFVLDGTPLPDPCSRWQPEGLRGPSRVFDATEHTWSDQEFRTPGLAR
jgi:maltooligosyltrehalose trehalohydrolase